MLFFNWISTRIQIPKQDIGKYTYYTLKVLGIKDSLVGHLVGVHLWFEYVPDNILRTGHHLEFLQE